MSQHLKTSEQYFKSGIKDSISIFCDKGGVTITQYYEKDKLLEEEIKDPTKLVTKTALKRNEYLYYYLTNINTILILLKFTDAGIDNDKLKKEMVSNLLFSLKSRLNLIRCLLNGVSLDRITNSISNVFIHGNS